MQPVLIVGVWMVIERFLHVVFTYFHGGLCFYFIGDPTTLTFPFAYGS
jgi:hypothetical protein